MLALVLTMQGAPPLTPPWYGSAGRIINRPCLHVGVRPAVYVDAHESALGFTIQVTR